MTRLRGRSLRGTRCHDEAPHGHWSTTTMISSVRGDGTTSCMTIDGAITGEVFEAYVRHILLPTLQRGDVVVLDNLSSHKNKQALGLLEQAGVEVRFLPPYSPDLNPIEKMWSKVKALLRGMKARTLPALEQAIAAALARVTSRDASGWFASCGYSFI